MDKKALKKNLFWILAGIAPLLTFIAFIRVFANQGPVCSVSGR